MPNLFNSFLIYLQCLTKVFGVVAVKHAYDFSMFSRKKTSRMKTVMKNQYYSAGLPKIYGPGNQEFSEVLCRRCTPSMHALCPVASSKSWMGSKARRSRTLVLQAVGCSSLHQVFGCAVSALHHVLFTFPVSPTCVCGGKSFEKKLASSFLLLSLIMADGSSVSEHALADFD